MNKKGLLIFVLIIAILLAGFGLIYFKKVPAPFVSGIFPGGGNPVPGTTPVNNGQQGQQDEPGQGSTTIGQSGVVEKPRLYELHKTPVAGIGILESTVRGPIARYVERGLGHIYETPLVALTETRISNRTHTQLGEALWGNNGKNVVIRYVDIANQHPIKTRVIGISEFPATKTSSGATSTQNTLLRTEEVAFPDFIPFMAVAEDGADKVFYLENSRISSVGTLDTYRKTSPTTLLNSPFTEWLPQFPNQNLVTLTSRPSAEVPRYLFFVDTKTKRATKILGGINGLTTKTSRDGKSVLYAEIKGGMPTLSVYDVSSKVSRRSLLRTLPEKCAWSAKEPSLAYCMAPQDLQTATYPDQWYQGLVSFSDELWQIDAKTASIKKIGVSLPAIDATNPVLSSKDEYLLFINKTTGTPWMYHLNM